MIAKITETLQRNNLCLEDKRFLCDDGIQLSISPHSQDIRPQILFGCTDLFSLIKNEFALQHMLPPGLRFILSKLGYLVAGRSNKGTTVSENGIDIESNEINDGTAVSTLKTSSNKDSLES
ncbi:hypothetical protein RB195_014335 [Necator americanus]|uniref:Uncharacterized protein n=1 Tax=Necator americanus TaxID=51031 RepID=A0ABR1DZR1_NECAM